MSRVFFAIFLFLIAAPSIASDSTADSTNEAYQNTLVEVFFNAALSIGELMSLVGLGWLCWTAIRNVNNPSLVQQEGSKPLTAFKFAMGLAVISILYLPLHSMSLFNDFTGLAGSNSLTMCIAVDVRTDTYDWINDADACVTKVERQVTEMSQFQSTDHLESANVGLLFGVVQLISLIFFLSSAWMLLRHLMGAREVKLTVGACIIAMLLSSVGMTLNNVTEYIKDFRGEQSEILPG
jgi:hypothetical protein